MSETALPSICPKCGAEIPKDAAEGLCPKCLLNLLAFQTEAGTLPGSKASQPPDIGELAAAFPHLEILELAGRGGMGFVFKARQPKLDRFVALKILPQSLAADPAFAERFTREGRLLARLNHPNIVTIHDFGVAKEFFYLLMEFVDGANLRQAMRAGQFTPNEALAVVPKICEALEYAHNEGILHRDIKPENILLDTRGRVKIADFGIAKMAGDKHVDGTLTGHGASLGTPHYMAPEQVEKPSTVDHRADIYSLGVVFYEMLTGELPLGRFAAPSEKSGGDPRLDDVVMRTLAKEPERRTQRAGEVKTQLETIASSKAEPEPISGDWLRNSKAYATTREHLKTILGQIWIYTGKGQVRINQTVLEFLEGSSQRRIPLSKITNLSVGHFPRLIKPFGLDFILVQYQEERQELEFCFTPYEGKFDDAISEWFQQIRSGVISCTGHPPEQTSASDLKTGASPLVKISTAALIPVALILFASFVFRFTPGRIGGVVPLILIAFGLGLGSLYLGTAAWRIRQVFLKGGKEFFISRLARFLGWIFLIYGFLNALSVLRFLSPDPNDNPRMVFYPASLLGLTGVALLIGSPRARKVALFGSWTLVLSNLVSSTMVILTALFGRLRLQHSFRGGDIFLTVVSWAALIVSLWILYFNRSWFSWARESISKSLFRWSAACGVLCILIVGLKLAVRPPRQDPTMLDSASVTEIAPASFENATPDPLAKDQTADIFVSRSFTFRHLLASEAAEQTAQILLQRAGRSANASPDNRTLEVTATEQEMKRIAALIFVVDWPAPVQRFTQPPELSVEPLGVVRAFFYECAIFDSASKAAHNRVDILLSNSIKNQLKESSMSVRQLVQAWQQHPLTQLRTRPGLSPTIDGKVRAFLSASFEDLPDFYDLSCVQEIDGYGFPNGRVPEDGKMSGYRVDFMPPWFSKERQSPSPAQTTANPPSEQNQ